MIWPQLLCAAVVASLITLSQSEAVERVTTISCSVAGSCSEGWTTVTAAAGDKVLVHGVLQDARLPVVQLSPSTSRPSVTSGWQLGIRRVVLVNVQLSTPTTSYQQQPALWPVNAFPSVGSALILEDVRMVISTAAFNQHLAFLQKQPALEGDGDPNLHTDGRSFIHITNSTIGSTNAYSVTLLTGACEAQFTQAVAAGRDVTSALAWEYSTAGSNHTAAALNSSRSTGCNAVTVANSTVIPALQGAGTVRNSDQLLVLLQGNISLGQQVPGSIVFRRPVALVGLWSVLTGVDLEMRVNHLDIMAPSASLAFNTLVLENLGNGDMGTLKIAGPFSPIATVNMYALHCNRSATNKTCSVLMNVTLVVPAAKHMGFLGPLMPSDNSLMPAVPITHSAPSWRTVKYMRGPGPGSLLVLQAIGLTTVMVDVIYMQSAERPVVFKPLPAPVRTYADSEEGFITPFVGLIFNCADVKAGLVYRTQPRRLHVLLLRESVSLAPSNTSQISSIPISPIAASSAKYADDPRNWNITKWPAPVPRPSCLGDKPFVPYRTRVQGQLQDELTEVAMPEVDQKTGAVHGGVATLGFAYTRNAMYVPSFARQSPVLLTFRSVVLSELAQGAGASELEGAAMLPMALPMQAWTLLLWSVNSTLDRRAVRVQHSVLKLPEPEYQHLAVLGRTSRDLLIELAGSSEHLTVSDVMVHSNHITASAFLAPGIRGDNVTFMVDRGAQQALQALGTPYWWPASYQAAAAKQQAQLLPAILVPLVVLGLLAAIATVWLVRRRRRQRQASDPSQKPLRCVGQAPTHLGGTALDASPASDRQSNGIKRSGACAAAAKLQGSDPSRGSKSYYQSGYARGWGAPPEDAGGVEPNGSKRQSGDSYAARTELGRSWSTGSSMNGNGRGRSRFLPQFLDGNNQQQQQQQAMPDDSAASGSSNLVNTVMTGLQRWRSAVSSTAMQLAEQRHAGQAAAAISIAQASSQSDTSASLTAAAAAAANINGIAYQQQQPGRGLPLGPQSCASPSPGSTDSKALSDSSALVLKVMLGSGNYGQVWQGVWRGTPVAVKILHLPANALDPPNQQRQRRGSYQERNAQQQQQQQQQTPAVSQHVAVMEAVLSSQCSHPNVVQMYTYMLTPLLMPAAAGSSHAHEGGVPTIVGETGLDSYAGDVAAAAVAVAAACTAGGDAVLAAWELKLVMELCDLGTLRAAVDKGAFNTAGGHFMDPALVTLLARDVAAAMLHLHSDNVVHGDLKAGNVLLTSGGADPDGLWLKLTGSRRRLVAKVADFGLSTVLGPTDTHASLTARGTPTHMAPEAWSGCMSRAGDSYAFGMLLYEVITGLRPFTGMPLLVMAHEVAVKGMRPQWPPELPKEFEPLQQLAEACWRQLPEDRPAFADVFQTLDHWVSGQTAFAPAWLRPLQPLGTLQAPLPLLQLDGLQYSQISGAWSQEGVRQQDGAQRWQQQQQRQQQGQQQPDQHQCQQQGHDQSGKVASVPVAAVCVASTPSRAMNNVDWSEVSYDPAPGSAPATPASDST